MARQITPGEWGRVFAHAWIDPKFSHELSTDPARAVKSFLAIDPKTEVQLLQIPPKPADLTQPQLEDIRSGKTVSAFLAPFSC